MSANQRQPSSHAGARSQVAALESILLAQIHEYRALLACVEEKTEAIRHAQMERMAAIFEHEAAIVQRIGEAERSRVELIQQITSAMRPAGGSAMRVSEIAESLPDEKTRSRLLAVAEQLRAVAMDVRERSARVRAAAEALARHMSGVMQTVRSALSRAGVYEPKGHLAVGAQLDFSVDVRS